MANGDFLKYVSGKLQEAFALVTSAGAGDAGKLVKLDGGGKLDITLMPSGVGAETATVEASETLAAGDLVNVYFADPDTLARKADASDPAKFANGFVLAAVTSGQNGTVYFGGLNDQVSGLTPGAALYLDAATPGGLTETAPAGDGDIAQHVGFAAGAAAAILTLPGTVVGRVAA
jgi:hypothetical protein